MPNRVTIGANGDYPGTGAPATTADVIAAITAGHQWLVFIDDEVNWNATLDFAALGMANGKFIALEGGSANADNTGAVGSTVLKKTFSTGPMISTSGKLMPYFANLYFNGNKAAVSGDYPLLDIAYLDVARLRHCVFADSSGAGVRFGATATGQSAATAFDQCAFVRNNTHGFWAARAVDLRLTNCFFDANGVAAGTWANLYMEGHYDTSHVTYPHRGISTIADCRFRSTSPTKNIWLANVLWTELLDNSCEGGQVYLDPDSQRCLIDHTNLLGGASINNANTDPAIGNVERDTASLP